MSQSANEVSLIALLRLAYSGELAAARACEGHEASLRDETERAEVAAIRRQKIAHREALGAMLAGLGSGPSSVRERASGLIGSTLSLLCRLTGRLLPYYGAALLERKNAKEYDDAAALARAAGRDALVEPLLAMAEVELAHERYFKGKVRAHRVGALLPLPACTRRGPADAAEELRLQGQRRRALHAALIATLLSAVFVRVPLLGVPGYESGLVAGLVAALVGCWLAFETARARPACVELRWGVLRKTPGEAVYEETRSSLLAVAPVVLVPLALLVTQAARTGCRWTPGLTPFLFVALPAAYGGVALGVLFGSLTRKRSRALGLLAAFSVGGILTTLAEGLAGPRHVVHDLLLGPISVGAYMGYDRGLSFPGSVYLHRLHALIAFTALLACAAWWRTRSDAPAAGEEPPQPAEDGGWSASRANEPTRARFLLGHHRKGPRRLLTLLALLALPFLLNPHACGLLSGRPLLLAEMPAVVETPHFRLHHAPGTAVEAHLERLAVEHEFAWSQVTAWLEHEPDWKVDAWLHPDEDSLHRTTGARGYAFAAPWNHEYHAVAATGDVRQLRHELVHVLAADFGARPFRASWSTGLIEGLATALDEGYARTPEAHESIAAARAAGQVPTAGRLTSLVGFAASDMDLSYRAAASFVGYLLSSQGPGRFKEAYAHGDFQRAYGTSVEDLGRRWESFLETEVSPPALEAARARRRFDPGTHPAFHRSACPRLGREAGLSSPVQRARLLALADRPSESADAWCEAFRASADPRHLDAAAGQRVRSGELEAALVLVDRTLSTPVLDVDREVGLLRRRALLLAALGRGEEAGSSLQAAAALLRDDADLDAAGPPGDAMLEQLRLDRAALAAPLAEDYATAALQAREPGAEGLLADRLARWPESAALLRLWLLASKPGSGEAGRRRDQLALRFARLSPDTPRLAAVHLAEQARAAERETDWERAAGLQEALLALPDLPAISGLAAEDGLQRALRAKTAGRRVSRH